MHVLTLAQGLTGADLAAIAELERRTVAVDGGRLKLEWSELRGRTGAQAEDALYEIDGRLVGFLGLYRFGSAVELAGMVDPAARRRGIGTSLLAAGLSLCRERSVTSALLVTSPAGTDFAAAHELVLDHRELGLVLQDVPRPGPAEPALAVRRADPADANVVGRLHAAAFGWSSPDPLRSSADDAYATLLAERNGLAVATVRLTRSGSTAGVYGLAVDPRWQRRGIGHHLLRHACVDLRADGVERIELEVHVDNDRALMLYTSLGFTVASTEHYWRLRL